MASALNSERLLLRNEIVSCTFLTLLKGERSNSPELNLCVQRLFCELDQTKVQWRRDGISPKLVAVPTWNSIWSSNEK